jgi:CDP-6-deoxy-D-xylo-4-hexulose-3-dehydrase
MNWPLNQSNFSLFDRLKICKFFLTPSNFWTQSSRVRKYELAMADLMGFRFSVFVSSGSTANTILAMFLKDKIVSLKIDRHIVVLPSTTWQTSCSPWIREGFTPHFIDASLSNFGMDLSKLDIFLSDNHNKVAAVFPTSLLGFNINYQELARLKQKYPDISFFIDQCENNFGGFAHKTGGRIKEFTCTTSTYMGHELQSVEGGFIFTNNEEEYRQFLMYRNHGMVRSIDGEDKKRYSNCKVDSRFDFYSLGNNYRNSDIHAFLGLLDFQRVHQYVISRRDLYFWFRSLLNNDRYILPEDDAAIPFCLPIICKGETAFKRLDIIKSYCLENKIETRPIISGFLGYQTPYKQFMDEKDCPNSVFLHNNGIYIGLNSKVTKTQIIKIVRFLNEI